MEPSAQTSQSIVWSCWKFVSKLGAEQDGEELPLWVLVLGLLDVDQSLILRFQITEQARVLLWSATRCARDNSAGLSAPKHSAVPQWAEPGATPVRCVLPSLTPAAVASFPTSAQELVKVRQQEEQQTHPVHWRVVL